MRKKNNKGFMLAEAIISGTVVITSMIILYSTFNRLYSMHEEKNNYYSIDGVYATKEMINFLIRDDFDNFLYNNFNTSNYKIIINDGTCDTAIFPIGSEKEKFCIDLKNLYNINKMIITEYDKAVLVNEIKNTPINQTFKNYIDFVVDYYGISNTNAEYSYIVLTETKAGDSYYYSNLGIR